RSRAHIATALRARAASTDRADRLLSNHRMTSTPRSNAEAFLAHPPPPARPKIVRAVRSTLVSSGLVILRERGLFDRYAATLSTTHVETVRGIVAGAWLPTEFMIAHYAAWDGLGLAT